MPYKDKEAEKKFQSEYRLKHRTKLKEYKASYDIEHKDKQSSEGKKWRKKNPDKVKELGLKRDFGISLNQYKELLARQNNVCAICSQPETSKQHGKIQALAVDHCHKTGTIRKLLCSSCNTGLGKFKDSPKLLRLAAEYLEKEKTQELP